MKATITGLTVVLTCLMGLLVSQTPVRLLAAPDSPAGKLSAEHSSLKSTAIAAVVEANGGKVPATGEDLWKALTKLGKFAQLAVPFSAVRLDSGLSNPRVIITPVIDGLSHADVTKTNFNGRLFLAANMEKDAKGGDPRVRSVEFISWNTQRRQFDFGAIENMGGEGEPELRIVDGGRCFSCHKNRGPILNPAPWSNSTNHPVTVNLVAAKFGLAATNPPGGNMRDRIDGMALASPEASAVDSAVRLGTVLQLNRRTFQLMNRSASGRKAFTAMLLAIATPATADPNEKHLKTIVDEWGDSPSYRKFTVDWVSLVKATNSGILVDYTPHPKVNVDPWFPKKFQPLPTPPATGFRSPGEAHAFELRAKNITEENEKLRNAIARQAEMIAKYDLARADGRHGLPSKFKPSNRKAFIQPAPKATLKPSGMVNPVMLASTIGLTEGDREFITRALNEAVQRVSKPRVTATSLARAVFEGPQFADVLSGGSLPDRDEFKDRFAAGLQHVLKTRYPFTEGIPIKRTQYASGPVYDPAIGKQTEIAVTPTTACLRCHDVRSSAKRAPFDSIPPLAFDPFDQKAREAWVKTAPLKRKAEVLGRLMERLHEDKDMPPEDSPEHEAFRIKQAKAFEEVKEFLTRESSKAK